MLLKWQSEKNWLFEIKKVDEWTRVRMIIWSKDGMNESK